MSDTVQDQNKLKILTVKIVRKKKNKCNRLGSLWNCMTANSLPGQDKFKNEEEPETPTGNLLSCFMEHCFKITH